MWNALHELTELGLLERDDTRRIRFFRINRDHDLVEPLKALFEAESKRINRLREAFGRSWTRGLYGSTLCPLFDSNARGDARPGSDADLLVVAADAAHVKSVSRVLMEAVPDIRRRFGLRISPFVLEKARIEERFRDGDPLMQNVLSEGRTLYGSHFHEIVGVW